MKKLSLFVLLSAASMGIAQAQTCKVITVVESIVPGGLGRSRMIENTQTADLSKLTTQRTEGTDGKDQNKISRQDAKIDEFKETKLLNYFSLVGINFQNIASNDAIISQRITELLQEGYELAHVSSGVESNSGEQDGNGIFITRMFFIKKP